MAKDKEYVERKLNFNSLLFKPEIGIPLGQTLRDSLYFTDNGQIIFPVSESDISSSPNPPLGGFNGREAKPMVAVFWDNADFSKGSGTIFYQEYVTQNSAKHPLVRGVEAMVQQYLSASYSARWTLKITWVKAQHYPAQKLSSRTNTYQAILTTDGYRTYTLFLYQAGGMQWDYTKLSSKNVLVGYTSGDGFFRNDDLMSQTPAVKYRPDRVPGYNTGVRGLWLYKLDSRIRVNYRQRCLDWLSNEKQPVAWNKDLPPCPCSLSQGLSDGHFTPSKKGRQDLCMLCLWEGTDTGSPMRRNRDKPLSSSTPSKRPLANSPSITTGTGLLLPKRRKPDGVSSPQEHSAVGGKATRKSTPDFPMVQEMHYVARHASTPLQGGMLQHCYPSRASAAFHVPPRTHASSSPRSNVSPDQHLWQTGSRQGWYFAPQVPMPRVSHAQNISAPSAAAGAPPRESLAPRQGHPNVAHIDQDSPETTRNTTERYTSAQPPPGEDIPDFASLMIRLTCALKVPKAKSAAMVEDPLFPAEEQVEPKPSALPSLPYLIHLTKNPGMAPRAVPAVSRRISARYRLDTLSAEFLKEPPKPNSAVVDMVQPRRSSPPDREGRKLDAMGKKVHETAALFTRMVHYGAYMAAYQSFLWGKIGPYLDQLPFWDQRMARAFCQEGTTLSRFQKDLAKHSAEAAGKLFASSVAIRRHAWLRASTLSDEDKAIAEDLPMHDTGLFNPETNDRLKHAHKMRRVAQEFGFPPLPHRRPFPGARRSRFTSQRRRVSSGRQASRARGSQPGKSRRKDANNKR
uniref:NIDO domain-containing protein n=1 Tax=Anolis carolinensis TaxID=28377 RepID=A0A803T9T3_ANOCA